ncbi:MAG TPA: ABC transporter permease [Stellaceae bacterium]|nr:ABC transporter permease [Stellaceae bacterium]
MRAMLSLGAKAALTLFGLLLVTFLIARVVPIDPVLAVVGDRASSETYARVRAEMGLDRPVAVQFGRYVTMLAEGDLGQSALTRAKVADDIARFFPATLELATVATLIGLVLGIPAGVIAAARHNRWPDHALRLVSLFGYSVPVFWLGLMALLLFYADLGWAAGPGRLDPWLEDVVRPRSGLLLVDGVLAGNGTVVLSALRHLALPAAILGYYSLAYISRMTRSLMLEQLNQDYIAVARAKGLSETRVLWCHALGNVLVPLATVATLAYAQLLEGSVLTETVFAWPGIGRYITGSLLSLDMNAVMGGTLVVGAVFIFLNLLVEGLYGRLDPRLR